MGKGPGSRERLTAKLNLGVAVAAEWDGRLARLFRCKGDERSCASIASFLAILSKRFTIDTGTLAP
jgi:hypothetical protein